MIPRKPLAPQQRRAAVSTKPAATRYPKSIERPSISNWAGTGRGVNGESVNAGVARPARLSPQFGMQS